MTDAAYEFPVGPIWRDANVRTGPDLSCSVIQLLLPGESPGYLADGWTIGEEVVEGTVVSSVWLRLGAGRFCSAVNFNPRSVAELPAAARLGPTREGGPSEEGRRELARWPVINSNIL
jgi:hypothetical protein